MKLAVLLLVVACSPDRGPKYRPAGNATPHEGGTYRIAIKDQFRTLDPTIAYDEASSIPMHMLFETLVDYDDEQRIVPRLAEQWNVSPDGTTYTFTLREGIVYSDGTPINAGDFKYSLERALQTDDSPFKPFLADIAEITVASPRELVIKLSAGNAAFIYLMAMSFATPQRSDHVRAAGDQLRRLPLGAGPFRLDSWDEGQRLVLRRNDNYWNPSRVHLDQLVMLENIPRDTQFLMFERGELESAERLAAPDLLWVIDQPDWKPYVHRRATMATYGSRMNVRKKPFDDRRVRQALNYALNKQHSIKLLNGAGTPSHGMLPPGMFGRDETLAPYPYDPAKARALLAEAGYPNGFDTEYVVMNDEEAERLAGSLQSDLAAVGVRVHIQLMSFATYLTALGRPDGPPFSKATWLGDYPDPTNFVDARFHSRMIADENSNNDSFYVNPELDGLLDLAKRETDLGKRAELYHRVERILYDDAPWIWEYHQVVTEVTQPYVRDYSIHPIWLRDYSSVWLDVGPNGERVTR